MSVELETPRLILQPLSAKHADDLFHVFSDEETMRFWDHPPRREIPMYAIHPILPVRDASESIAFYRDCLGFNTGFVGEDPPDFAIMSRGEWSSEQAHIQLSQSSEVAPVRLFLMMGPYIDQLHDEYHAKGVTITSTPTTQAWGKRDFSIQDNNGHHITFGANA